MCDCGAPEALAQLGLYVAALMAGAAVGWTARGRCRQERQRRAALFPPAPGSPFQGERSTGRRKRPRTAL